MWPVHGETAVDTPKIASMATDTHHDEWVASKTTQISAVVAAPRPASDSPWLMARRRTAGLIGVFKVFVMRKCSNSGFGQGFTAPPTMIGKGRLLS